MLPAPPATLLVSKLAVNDRLWRIPRNADLRLKLVNTPLARAPGAPGLPYAFPALAGRYISDLVSLSFQESWKGPRAILNPVIEHSSSTLAAVLAEAADANFGIETGDTAWLVLQDYQGQPIAYLIPPAWQPDASLLHELRYLSGYDAAVDAELLLTLNVSCVLRTLRLPPAGQPGLSDTPRLLAFPGMENLAVQSARARRNMLIAGKRQTLAVVTHHAGDVLLTTQVLEAYGHEIDGIVVHRSYGDVARSVGGKLPIIEVDGPLPARGDASSAAHPLNEEILYFERVVAPALPADASFLFLRPSRGYIDSDYTLAAQLAYTVGQLGDEAHYPTGFHLTPPTPASLQANRSSLPRVRGRRVLLHFDGGWPLKVYPPAWQRELVDALVLAGFKPSVLGPGFPDVPSHAFTGLAALSRLMGEQDVLIGMDSFPCHYASQALNLPTVCLFASTRMENLAHAARDYIAVEQGLSCSPCGSRLVCPRFGGVSCHNFLPPAAVVDLLEHCLQEL